MLQLGQMSQEQVIELLKKNGGNPMTPKEIATKLEITESTIYKSLKKLVKNKEVNQRIIKSGFLERRVYFIVN